MTPSDADIISGSSLLCIYTPWLARHCATHAIKRKTTCHVSPGNAPNCASHTFRGKEGGDWAAMGFGWGWLWVGAEVSLCGWLVINPDAHFLCEKAPVGPSHPAGRQPAPADLISGSQRMPIQQLLGRATRKR